MNGLGKRLKHARALRKLKVREVAAHFGVSASAVTQWEQDQTTPDGEKLLCLPAFLQVDPLWLLYNIGLPEPSWNGNVPAHPRLIRSNRLPRISAGAAAAGYAEAVEVTDDFVAAIDGSTTNGDFAIDIWDGSNAPEMTAGDYVVIRPTKNIQPGDYVLVAIGADRKPILGQLGRVDTGWVIVHANRLWGKHSIAASDEIVGVRVAHVRTFGR